MKKKSMKDMELEMFEDIFRHVVRRLLTNHSDPYRISLGDFVFFRWNYAGDTMQKALDKFVRKGWIEPVNKKNTLDINKSRLQVIVKCFDLSKQYAKKPPKDVFVKETFSEETSEDIHTARIGNLSTPNALYIWWHQDDYVIDAGKGRVADKTLHDEALCLRMRNILNELYNRGSAIDISTKDKDDPSSKSFYLYHAELHALKSKMAALYAEKGRDAVLEPARRGLIEILTRWAPSLVFEETHGLDETCKFFLENMSYFNYEVLYGNAQVHKG